MPSKKQSERRMFVDYKRHTYTTAGGVVLKLRPVSMVTVELLRGDMQGQPQVPVVSVVYGDDVERTEANPNDPDYIAALARWKSDKDYRTMVYVWTSGIEDDPPDEALARLSKAFPYSDRTDLKMLWLTELLTTENEVIFFTGAIMGQNAVTEEGIAESEATFPGDGR